MSNPEEDDSGCKKYKTIEGGLNNTDNIDMDYGLTQPTTKDTQIDQLNNMVGNGTG